MEGGAAPIRESSLHPQPLTGIPNLMEQQDQWARRLMRMLLAKQFVQGVIWDAWDDRLPHELAHAGILGQNGSPRALAQDLVHLRRQFLC